MWWYFIIWLILFLTVGKPLFLAQSLNVSFPSFLSFSATDRQIADTFTLIYYVFRLLFLVNFGSQALNTSSRITNWSIPLHINFYCHEALQPLSIFSTKRSQLNNSSTSELKETLSIKTNYMNFSSQSFWKTDIHWLQLGFLFWKKKPHNKCPFSLFLRQKDNREDRELPEPPNKTSF